RAVAIKKVDAGFPSEYDFLVSVAVEIADSDGCQHGEVSVRRRYVDRPSRPFRTIWLEYVQRCLGSVVVGQNGFEFTVVVQIRGRHCERDTGKHWRIERLWRALIIEEP